ncbi:ABC transporter substrate-binding protein [Rhodopila sp.]|uniref:ABC transporter substrate-binding protein n=1 Tax=Rhodopila sp. TaxID=2480087 RepID=UPI002C363C18|nr:ABC transporter substrate-binding protein [Rhodopila sp.]HVZ10238.1 ABC transporter substrate-binding protein [Rhodopila sp.]
MTPTRRHLLAGSAALALGRPFLARAAASADTLRFIPQADVTILDPLATTAYTTRNHGHMCWDTLYGLDEAFAPSPQLAEGHVVEDGGKHWTFTLRDGLLFHDGEKVRAQDAVASIRRWLPRDSHGQVLAQRLQDIKVLDDRRFEIRLTRPFGPMLDALAKPWSYPCFIYPERFAAIDPTKPFTEVVGSGPYRFVAGEHVSGAQLVYERFDRYSPTPVGKPSLMAGPKLAGFRRQEWQIITDAATAAAALQSGEIDWWETVTPDLRPLLARSSQVVLDEPEQLGLYASLRFNHLLPPFDDPAARRALLKAVQQSDFMTAVAGTDPSMWREGVGVFPADTPLASNVGMDALTSPRDLDAARSALRASGHFGAPIVALHATNVPNQDALMTVGIDMLRQLGFATTDATSDWGTLLQRRANTSPLNQGGWSVLIALFSGAEFMTPAGNVLLRGNGKDAWFGWPTAPRLEELREAWFDAPDMAAQKTIAADIQRQFFVDVPYIPLGQYLSATGYRKDLTDIRRGIVLPLNVRRV